MTFKPANPRIGAFGNDEARKKALAAFRRGDVAALVSARPALAAQPIQTGQRIIVPLLGPDGKPIKAGYLEARKLAAAQGGQLPSHVLHDDVLVKLWDTLPEAEKAKLNEYYPAWVRELVAHPAKDGEFVSGSDIVDSKTGWILPWSEVIKLIPASELSGKKKGLFIDPRDIVTERGKTIVLPASIILLHPFIQTSGEAGKVHEATRVPLAIEPQTEEEKRWLIRGDDVRIGLLVRNGSLHGVRRGVGAVCGASNGLGVGVERSESPVPSSGSPVSGSQVSGLGTALPGLSPVPRVR